MKRLRAIVGYYIDNKTGFEGRYSYYYKTFFKTRSNKNIKSVNLNMLCNKIDINKAEYTESSNKICDKILSEAKSET